ncbi:MAG: hypothetical protein FWE27_05645 [Defluviitaleaceae bacterium]|nr:hypothetical protein [Defluviitaleaceae bacterium]
MSPFEHESARRKTQQQQSQSGAVSNLMIDGIEAVAWAGSALVDAGKQIISATDGIAEVASESASAIAECASGAVESIGDLAGGIAEGIIEGIFDGV